jgi:hypothetical protein
MPKRTIVYIDGFNLYHGLKGKYGKKYMWLDIEQFANLITPENHTFSAAKYFTSRIKGDPADPDKPKRQAVYWRAIKSLEPRVITIEGNYQAFQSHCKHCNTFIHCPNCGVPHIKPNEKKTDVNIATAMLVDAFENKCEQQILVSGDSDYENTLMELRRLFPEKELIVAFPPKRRNNKLMGENKCTSAFDIPEDAFSKAQFPETITTSDGKIIQKPAEWI